MPDSIFLLDAQQNFRELTEAHYLTEAKLQELLADHPQLLAGKQLDGTNPRRWLLVKRELGIPDAEDSANRWSIDHLFLDQDGIPTLVEVKRSTDTRIRREVVGQLLDYAAHATVYWTLEGIRNTFEQTCATRGVDPDEALEAFLGGDAGEILPEHEQFWENVQTNLRAGKVRLLIVADTMPSELQRIIEFLNEQMDPAEFLGIAIKQYKADGLRTLVPRVVGMTTAGEGRKSSGRRSTTGSWTLEDLYQHTDREDPAAGRAVRRLVAHFEQRGISLISGTGRKPTFIFVAEEPVRTQLFAVGSRNFVEVYFQWYLYRPPFDQLAYRQQLMDRLNAIDGIDLPADRIAKRPSFPLSVLDNEKAFGQFVGAYGWFLEEIKATDR